jgi:proliferating cell nuclear antigen
MSFAATIQADVLSSALAPVSALVDECKLRTSEGGLGITAVDPANVGMVDVDLDASAAASWSADDHVLGINLERLLEVISLADSDEMLHLSLDAETRKLSVEAGGLEVTIAMIDPDTIRAEPDIPDLELPGTYVLEGRELSRAVTAADLVSDHIEITGVDEETLMFAADGDTDDVRLTLSEELLSARHDSGELVESLFSLSYLESMSKPMAADTEVSLLVGDEFPVKMRYSLADGSIDVTNMLAPRIQSN